jgi:hypothetical protein
MKLFLLLLLAPIALFAQKEITSSGSAQGAAFVNSLTDAQKSKAVFRFGEMNRYEWHYVPPTMLGRTGLAIKDMENSQKEKVYSLLQAFLSKEGYDRTKNIMDFEYLLKELQPDNPNRIPENYFISIYGTPAIESVWGFKFTGHHITLNFTIVKDKLSFAPVLFGVYPANVQDGPKKGTRLLKEEEDLGFELVNSLDQSQKEKALIQLEAFSDILTTNAMQVGPLKPDGILARDMTTAQKVLLNKLIVTYLLPMPPLIAQNRMKKITAEDIDAIRFAWAGGTQPGKAHYYRVQGKSFLIEFDNTQNNANHIHEVWRDFNGDFGEDLLREHYHNSPHHH